MRRLLTGMVLVLGSAIWWAYTSIPYILWDGGVELTVHVSSTAGPLRSVSCEAVAGRKDGDSKLESLLPPETSKYSTCASPFAGKPLTVYVPTSGRASMSDHELSYTQFRHLVVIGQYPDGRRVGALL